MAKKAMETIDPRSDVEAMKEVYNAGKAQAEAELTKLRGEVEGIRHEAEALGIIKKIKYDLKHNEMIKYVVMFQVKESKSYRKGGMTWEAFCESIGEAQRTVDRILEDLRPVVNEFSANLAEIAGVPFNKIRYLGRSVSANLAEIETVNWSWTDRESPSPPSIKTKSKRLSTP